MEEDWDAEIDGTAPVNNFQSLSIKENRSSPASKYFDDGYSNNDQVDDSFNGFGSHITFDGNRGRERGRGRGRGSGFDRNGSG